MIDPNEVAVFFALPAALADAERRAAAMAAITGDDVAHVTRFRFERDRDIALASRALQRRALSSCATGPVVAPSAWRFTTTGNGRPEILSPGLATALRFNVSNTRGLVACAVTSERDVGVDVEEWRADAPSEIVESHFAPLERAALRALPPAEHARRFIELWTLKEAYIKARGLGLELPLDRFWFELAGGEPRLAIDPVLGDDAASWQVALWSPTPGHCAALCVRRNAGAPLRIAPRWELG